MKFLKEAIEQTSRRLQFQEWILLLLRCLALILLALALARPGFGLYLVGRQRPAHRRRVRLRHVVQHGREGRRQDAPGSRKEAALAIIETLPDKSSIHIYACSDRSAALGPSRRTTATRPSRLDLSRSKSPSLSADLLPGLAEAHDAAENGTAPAQGDLRLHRHAEDWVRAATGGDAGQVRGDPGRR